MKSAVILETSVFFSINECGKAAISALGNRPENSVSSGFQGGLAPILRNF